MAQALPSFVELLASLDLESGENSEVQHYARYPTSPSFVSSSPSSSLRSLPSSQSSTSKVLTSPNSATSFTSPSPSIIISHPSPVHDSMNSRRRSISNRYNPYVPPNVLTRRCSLPGDLKSSPQTDCPGQTPNSYRASSASPPARRTSLGNSANDSTTHLSTRISMSKVDQPISALVRRRHPHSPPQSSDFLKTDRRSISPTNTFILGPVSLPSLPPLPRITSGANSFVPPTADSPHLPPPSAMSSPPMSSRSPIFSEARMAKRSSPCHVNRNTHCSFAHETQQPVRRGAIQPQ